MFQVIWREKKCMFFPLPSMHVPCPTYLISLNSFTLITPCKNIDHTAPRHEVFFFLDLNIFFSTLSVIFISITSYVRTAVAQCLRFCATNRKVAVSIPAGVSGFFNDIKTTDCSVALGSTQPLTEMITRIISWR